MIGLATHEDLEAINEELKIIKGEQAKSKKEFEQLIEEVKKELKKKKG